MHFLVTGHTGFKGSWLALWLSELGHTVHGLALAPERGSLFEEASVGRVMASSVLCDIRDFKSVHTAVTASRADVVIHLAAQPFVREAYRDPRVTFETNSMGTLNLLESVACCDTVQAQVIITTDKVYRNTGATTGYIESDPLGGDDPYSASKAMADILTTSWMRSFNGPPTAIARAGNVIGGGDASRERLLPNVIEACRAGRAPQLRSPAATRPWQHVLDCLQGYLLLADHLISQGGSPADHGAWNFGPEAANCVSVSEVADLALRMWGSTEQWTSVSADDLHEAAVLALDASKARDSLGWIDRLTLEEAVGWTVDWYREVDSGSSAYETTCRQIRVFHSL